MVDFPLRAVELNLQGSGLRILGHTESTDNTEIIFSNTNLANLTNYDAGGKGFTINGSGLKVPSSTLTITITITLMMVGKRPNLGPDLIWLR